MIGRRRLRDNVLPPFRREPIVNDARRDFLSQCFQEHDQLDYRRWASDCEKQAHDPLISGDEREYLLNRQRALLVLAASEDWLRGEEEAGGEEERRGPIGRKGH